MIRGRSVNLFVASTITTCHTLSLLFSHAGDLDAQVLSWMGLVGGTLSILRRPCGTGRVPTILPSSPGSIGPILQYPPRPTFCIIRVSRPQGRLQDRLHTLNCPPEHCHQPSIIEQQPRCSHRMFETGTPPRKASGIAAADYSSWGAFVPKSHSDKWRMIVDLSSPRGGVTVSMTTSHQLSVLSSTRQLTTLSGLSGAWGVARNWSRLTCLTHTVWCRYILRINLF